MLTEPYWAIVAELPSREVILIKDASESTVMAPPTNPNPADTSAKQSLEAGLAALKQQDYPTAISLLESVTQTAANGPSGIRAQMGLVAAYKQPGNLKKANRPVLFPAKSPNSQVKTRADRALTELTPPPPPPQNHRQINQNPQKLPPKQALSPLMQALNRRKNRLGAIDRPPSKKQVFYLLSRV